MSRFRIVLLLVAAFSGAAGAADFVQEPPRQTPVIAEGDVVVIGGGLSGVGAAVGAAKTGAKTIVIEQTGYLGGWLRGTGMGNVLAISNWRPTLQEGALFEITKQFVSLHPEGYPDVETAIKRGDLEVTNQELLPQAFQQLLTQYGVKILFFSTYSGSIVKNGKIDSVLIQNQAGRAAVRGKVFIDCTGLATVAAESGAPVVKSEAFMGLAAWITGVDVKRFGEYQQTLPKDPDPKMKEWLEQKLGQKITSFKVGAPNSMDFPWDDWMSRNANVLGAKYRESVDRGETPLMYRVGKKGVVSFCEGVKVTQFDATGGLSRPRTYITGVDPTNILELSEAHEKSTEFLFKLTEFLNKNIPGFEKAQLSRIAEQTLNRAGRSIENGSMPENEDINVPVKHADFIAILKRGEKNGEYQVPYSAMLSEKISNLLAVGKSSAGGIKFRTHNLTVIMGQAAGTAAAICVKDNVQPKSVDIKKVRAELRKAGVPLPEE